MEIKLKKVSAVEVEEKGHGKSQWKQNWTNRDLPFTGSSDHLGKWQQRFILSLINWLATLKELFGSNNHQDFKLTVKKIWKRVFNYLPALLDNVQEEHLAIYGVVSCTFLLHVSS